MGRTEVIQGRRPERCYPNCINQDGRCIYCGWAKDEEAKMAGEPPWIYDISTDERRPVTQADVEVMEAVEIAYGDLRKAMFTTQVMLMHRISTIRSKHGLPHDPSMIIPSAKPAAPLEQAADPDPGA